MKKITYAFYTVPKKNSFANKARIDETTSAKKARKIRDSWNSENATKIAIHVGESHPDPLPFGNRLWR